MRPYLSADIAAARHPVVDRLGATVQRVSAARHRTGTTPACCPA
jgi:hypothetical protein